MVLMQILALKVDDMKKDVLYLLSVVGGSLSSSSCHQKTKL